MAGSKRPSFLKRQKEQARLARASEKRETRLARRHAKANGLAPPDGTDPDLDLDPLVEGEGGDDVEGEEPPPHVV